MGSWVPFLLLPIYFGALIVAMLRFAPRTDDAATSADAPRATTTPGADKISATPPSAKTDPPSARRARPKHASSSFS